MPPRFAARIREPQEQFQFATVFDGIVRIFCNNSWSVKLAKLESDPVKQSKVAHLAYAHGGDVELDSQDRFSLPAAVRRKVALDGQQVQMEYGENDVISIYRQDQYDAMLAQLEQEGSDLHSWSATLGFSL